MVCWLLPAVLLFPGCDHSSGPGIGKRLPKEYLGVWILEGAGGGIDGHWETDESGRSRLELTRENVAIRSLNGREASRQSFTVDHGNTIFGECWMIRYPGDPEAWVLQLSEDGRLSLSLDVYDGGGSVYRRAESGSSSQPAR